MPYHEAAPLSSKNRKKENVQSVLQSALHLPYPRFRMPHTPIQVQAVDEFNAEFGTPSVVSMYGARKYIKMPTTPPIIMDMP